MTVWDSTITVVQLVEIVLGEYNVWRFLLSSINIVIMILLENINKTNFYWEIENLFLLRPLRLHSGYFGNAPAYSRLQVYLPVCLHFESNCQYYNNIIITNTNLDGTTVTSVSHLKWSSDCAHCDSLNKIYTNSWRTCGALLFLIGSIELVLMPAFF